MLLRVIQARWFIADVAVLSPEALPSVLSAVIPAIALSQQKYQLSFDVVVQFQAHRLNALSEAIPAIAFKRYRSIVPPAS